MNKLAIFLGVGMLGVLAVGEVEAAPARSRTQSNGRQVTRRTPARRHRVANYRAQGRRGAFSKVPLGNKAGLMRELRRDPVYRARLAKHFGVSQSEIVEYADQHLEYSRLRRATKSSVWGVNKSGKTFRVTQNLPAGTPVFRIAGGPTVLKEVCGNVVTPVLPPVPRAVRRRGNVLPPGPLATNSEAGFLDAVPGEPGFLPTSVPVGPEYAPAFAPALASFPGEMMAVPAAVAPGGVVGGGGGGFVPPFWLLAGAGAAFIHGDGGDSFTPPIPPPPPPPQVPEPASMLLLAAGALPLVGALRRRGGKLTLPAMRFILRR